MSDPIYRDFSLDATKKGLAEFMQHLIVSKGSITGMFSIGEPTLETVRYHTVWYRLRFSNQKQLDFFHRKYSTKVVPTVNTN
jgi:hypothetical protein